MFLNKLKFINMKTIQNISLLLVLCMISSFAIGQKKVKSPPKELADSFNGTAITINYNAPSVRDRVIWGDLVPFNEVWRTGANTATKITLDKNTEIDGQQLAAGTYALFTIPTEKTWTVIFNSESDQWGAYKYNKDKDVLRVTVEPVKAAEKTEQMTFVKADESSIHLLWDNLAIPIKIGAMQ